MEPTTRAGKTLTAAASSLAVFLLMAWILAFHVSRSHAYLWYGVIAYTASTIVILCLGLGANIIFGFKPPNQRISKVSKLCTAGAVCFVLGKLLLNRFITKQTPSGHSGWHHIAYIYVCGGLMAPFLEETLFRGSLWSAISGRWQISCGPVSIATLITALLFGSLHWPGIYGQATTYGWPIVVSATLGGLVFGVLRDKTKVIWFGLAMHIVGNAVGF